MSDISTMTDRELLEENNKLLNEIVSYIHKIEDDEYIE